MSGMPGRIYTGVCVDTCGALGICAERNAIFNMLTNGEQDICKVLAVMSNGKTGAPCGACRELMVQRRDRICFTPFSGYRAVHFSDFRSYITSPER